MPGFGGSRPQDSADFAPVRPESFTLMPSPGLCQSQRCGMLGARASSVLDRGRQGEGRWIAFRPCGLPGAKAPACRGCSQRAGRDWGRSSPWAALPCSSRSSTVAVRAFLASRTSLRQQVGHEDDPLVTGSCHPGWRVPGTLGTAEGSSRPRRLRDLEADPGRGLFPGRPLARLPARARGRRRHAGGGEPGGRAPGDRSQRGGSGLHRRHPLPGRAGRACRGGCRRGTCRRLA